MDYKQVMDIVKRTMGMKQYPGIQVLDAEERVRRESLIDSFRAKGYITIVNPEHTMMVKFSGPELVDYVTSILHLSDLESASNVHYPTLNQVPDKLEPQSASYGTEYVIQILKMLDPSQGGVKLTLKKSYPLQLDVNENITVLLAPRMEQE